MYSVSRFSVVNLHELSTLFRLQPLSVEEQGQAGAGARELVTATTHATVFENDGLVTKVIGSHMGGVVRFLWMVERCL